MCSTLWTKHASNLPPPQILHQMEIGKGDTSYVDTTNILLLIYHVRHAETILKNPNLNFSSFCVANRASCCCDFGGNNGTGPILKLRKVRSDNKSYWAFTYLYKNKIRERHIRTVKGSMTRDFRLQILPGPWVSHWGHFKCLRKFTEICAVQLCVFDTGDKLLTGVNDTGDYIDSMTPMIDLSPVSMKPAITNRRNR
jgi:hypothetical protein